MKRQGPAEVLPKKQESARCWLTNRERERERFSINTELQRDEEPSR